MRANFENCIGPAQWLNSLAPNIRWNNWIGYAAIWIFVNNASQWRLFARIQRRVYRIFVHSRTASSVDPPKQRNRIHGSTVYSICFVEMNRTRQNKFVFERCSYVTMGVHCASEECNCGCVTVLWIRIRNTLESGIRIRKNYSWSTTLVRKKGLLCTNHSLRLVLQKSTTSKISVAQPDPHLFWECGFGSRSAKMTYKNRKKFRNSMFKCWIFSFEGWRLLL